MRESFESGREMISSCAGAGGLKRSRQHPMPAIVTVVVSLMQKPCGVSVVARVPDPGCRCLGGIAYRPTVSTFLLRLNAGDAEFRDEVFVSAQTRRSVDVPVPGVQGTPESHCSSSPASELMKYSVPPSLVLNCPGVGDCAGHRVKPGCPPTLLVSTCTTGTFAAPTASAAFENA